ncbi:hypothetical protein [Nonomuraea sp. NPDC049695]|uniref:hypothetical protein n=1 Tax=Nonomuraea sp. NPDC049695 TaxID=3154734 RepID=UPI00341FDD7B
MATLGQLRLRATEPKRDFADTFLRRNGIDDMLMAATLGPFLSPYFNANPVPTPLRNLTSAERDVAEPVLLGLGHEHIARRLNVCESATRETPPRA